MNWLRHRRGRPASQFIQGGHVDRDLRW